MDNKIIKFPAPPEAPVSERTPELPVAQGPFWWDKPGEFFVYRLDPDRQKGGSWDLGRDGACAAGPFGSWLEANRWLLAQPLAVPGTIWGVQERVQ